MSVFNSYSPFIRDFIYSRGWQELSPAQVSAAEIIFGTEDNLLLPSQTASGKTEAAFFPILSEMYADMPNSIGVLYIAPLKSLINDQFGRISELCDEAGIPVTHWHGDVAASHKQKLMKNPAGILQITPESVEAMLVRRSADLPRLFCDLRYIIIDEVHTLMGCDRGNQIICQLSRLMRKAGCSPRRIGLSATIGDMEKAAAWLGAGSGRNTRIAQIPPAKIRWKLGMEHFYIDAEDGNKTKTGIIKPDKTKDSYNLDPGYEYVYDSSKGKKCIVFSNSREETEYVCATLREIAEYRHEPDVFLIHHGFLSASIREEAELKMKEEDTQAVTCATVTMELGIDIGRLERVIQLNATTSVSSFLQRLGRSGRRGDPPEMMMVFREETPLPNTPLPELIPWELLRGIAVVQLYIEERFIEPPAIKKCPFSLLFHQTMSVVASNGSLTVPALADTVLSLPPFSEIEKEDYRRLIVSMVNDEWLDMTDEREIIVGLKGERLISSYKFFAVFKETEDYTVRCESEEIGVISSAPPVGERFALAGRVWEVTELDIEHRLIFVKSVKGKMKISWPGDYGEIHTKIVERMRRVLMEDTEYPYLRGNALERLRAARKVSRETGMCESCVLPLGGMKWVFFPWLGTRSFRTIRRYIAQNSGSYGISDIESEGCCYMTFNLRSGARGEDWFDFIMNKIRTHGIDVLSLVKPNEIPMYDKFDGFIPPELLRKAYCADRLRTDEIVARL